MTHKPLQTAPVRRYDPYSLWAVDTGFRYAKAAEHARILLHTKSSLGVSLNWLNSAAEWLTIPGEYLRVAQAAIDIGKCHYCTAIIRRDALADVQARTSLDYLSRKAVLAFWAHVERFEIALDVEPTAPPDAGLPSPVFFPQGFLNIPFAGIVDIGIPVAQRELRVCRGTQDIPRLRAFWDQTDVKSTHPALGFNFGREWSEAKAKRRTRATPPMCALYLNAGVTSVSDEEKVYLQNRIPISLLRRSHGAAVTGEFVDESLSANADGGLDWAAIAPVLAVQLPRVTLAHSARGSLSAHVLDALRWLIARAGPKNRVVANVSLGTHGGPHDGSSILECAIDELIAIRRANGADRLAVVLAAGNSRNARCHAQLSLKANSPQTLKVRVLPDGETPSYVELWFPKGSQLSVELMSPSGVATGFRGAGQGILIASRQVPELAAGLYNLDVCAGGKVSAILAAIGPTIDGTAEAGDWTIRLTAKTNVPFLNAYVERNNSMFDLSRPKGRQAFFVDDRYKKDGEYPGGNDDDPLHGVIKRRGTLNSMATGAETVVVGAYVADQRVAAAYSGSGAPPISAAMAGDMGLRRRGMRVTATRSGDSTRVNGTSIAAPRVARRILNAMHSDANLAVKAWIQITAKTEGGGAAVDPDRVGAGTMDEARFSEPRFLRP